MKVRLLYRGPDRDGLAAAFRRIMEAEQEITRLPASPDRQGRVDQLARDKAWLVSGTDRLAAAYAVIVNV
ncbi:MAG: hypothetical protein OXN90_02815 [Gemmatimonadota bacterium]|nr:hypothetical protein [Gemmatimonadota bacterium]